MSPRKHEHRTFRANCRACKALKAKWYERLSLLGFVDIEYGLDCPRFVIDLPEVDESKREADQKYYEAIWQVFHLWSASKRSLRDCRVAELLAEQSGKTGTLRGISQVLRLEHLNPWTIRTVRTTISEIKRTARDLPQSLDDSPVYQSPRHKAA